MRRYTLIFHNYIGYGSYVIEFKRVRCSPKDLRRYTNGRYGELHYVIEGWPSITGPDGVLEKIRTPLAKAS